MESTELSKWIERLDAAAKKDRPAITEELAKALGIPVDEAWNKLKEAGWGSKGSKPSANASTEDNTNGGAPSGEAKAGKKKLAISLRHKTPHPRYRRAGLVLTDQFKPYEVTEEQLGILEKDAWVEIEKR
jgi:hypothetical protein